MARRKTRLKYNIGDSFNVEIKETTFNGKKIYKLSFKCWIGSNDGCADVRFFLNVKDWMGEISKSLPSVDQSFSKKCMPLVDLSTSPLDPSERRFFCVDLLLKDNLNTYNGVDEISLAVNSKLNELTSEFEEVVGRKGLTINKNKGKLRKILNEQHSEAN